MARETHVVKAEFSEILAFYEWGGWGTLQQFNTTGITAMRFDISDARRLAESLIQSQMLQGHLQHLLACVQEELNRAGCGSGCAD